MGSESQGEEYGEEDKGRSAHFRSPYHLFPESYEIGKVAVLVSVRKRTFMVFDALFNLLSRLQSRRHEGASTP